MNADSFWLQHDDEWGAPSHYGDPDYDAPHLLFDETQEVETPTKPYPVAPYDPDALEYEEWTPLQRAIWRIWERARRRFGL